MQEEKEAKFYTRSGAILDLRRPLVGALLIEDIGWSLANLCRFGGHCKLYFSMAEHAVAVSHMVSEKLAGQAFAFSFPCAYLGDHYLYGWPHARQRLWNVIAIRFGLQREMFADVTFADRIATSTELRELTNFPPEAWRNYPLPIHREIRPLGREHAYAMFIRRYKNLRAEGYLK